MTINGLSEYGGLYNNYSVRDIPKVDIETVKQQDAAKKAEVIAPEITAPVEPAVEAKPDNRSRIADLDNISLNFNTGDDYSYIGSDFEIGGLDMEKAISDMKKDKMLADYQYFVGSSSNLNELFSGNDGKVIVKF